MGVVGGPDPIVQDSLVYAIDPASTRSFISGSGTVTDLVGDTSNTITSGVQVVANPGTVWRWPDAVTPNYIDCGDNNTVRPLTGEVSYNYWVYPSGTGGYRVTLSCWSSTVSKRHIWFGCDQGDNIIDFYWNQYSRFSISCTPNIWTNICVTWDGTTLTGYKDGESQATSTPGISSDADNLSYGFDLNRNTYEWQGDLGPLHIYHKELTAAEVLQNYNALKDRFV